MFWETSADKCTCQASKGGDQDKIKSMNFKRRDNADLDRDLPRTKEESDHSEQPCFSKKISTSSLPRFIYCGKLDIPL